MNFVNNYDVMIFIKSNYILRVPSNDLDTNSKTGLKSIVRILRKSNYSLDNGRELLY